MSDDMLRDERGEGDKRGEVAAGGSGYRCDGGLVGYFVFSLF